VKFHLHYKNNGFNLNLAFNEILAYANFLVPHAKSNLFWRKFMKLCAHG